MKIHVIDAVKEKISGLLKKKPENNPQAENEVIDEEEQNASPGLNVKVDYDFHKIDFIKLCTRFNVSLTDGLNSQQAQELLSKNGKNVLSPPRRRIIRTLLGYLFTGFCGILWVASIICFLAWRPIGNPPVNEKLKYINLYK